MSRRHAFPARAGAPSWCCSCENKLREVGHSADHITSTCGLVAMTSASHAEGRQFDPGQVYTLFWAAWEKCTCMLGSMLGQASTPAICWRHDGSLPGHWSFMCSQGGPQGACNTPLIWPSMCMHSKFYLGNCSPIARMPPPGPLRHRIHEQYAHAGSRTRVTSMGGLYDAATLHAPCLDPRSFNLPRGTAAIHWDA